MIVDLLSILPSDNIYTYHQLVVVPGLLVLLYVCSTDKVVDRFQNCNVKQQYH